MVDFGQARAFMVDNQVRTSSISDRRIIALMGELPREIFVAPARRDIAYIDDVQWLGTPGSGRFMAAPAILAKLVQLAEITEADDVLDIGAGTGYSTALLAGLAGSVVGLESDAGLAAAAEANLAQLGIDNARIQSGDVAALTGQGFDVILVQGALDTVPQNFLGLLKDGGRLIALVRKGAVAVANVYVRTGTGVTARAEFNASLPPLFAKVQDDKFVF